MPLESYLPKVKEQYEVLPYPPRDPERERHRLVQRIGDNLIILNHHCYGGARDFRRGFRVLVAGGGTGDATIYLAEQLRALDGEVVHLDLAAASMEVARARATIRGLENIRWLNASILDIPGLDLGRFDYINCTGVLHHLESTEAGLAVLAGALKDDGVILLMLYGKYGRRSVYDMQALLRASLPEQAGIAEKIRMGRQLLASLPPTNAFVRDLDAWKSEIAADGFGDSGFYDLLLHSQDRCFTVPELYQLADSAGMDLLAFVDRAVDYEPLRHLKDPGAAAHLAGLEIRQRQAIAELMVSNLATHEFYLGRRGVHQPASLADRRNTLVLMGAMHGRHREISEGLTPGRTLSFTGRSGAVTVVGNPVNRAVFGCMDGLTPLERIYKRVQKSVPGTSQADVEREVRSLYQLLHPHGHLYLLRQGSYGVKVPNYQSMQAGS